MDFQHHTHLSSQLDIHHALSNSTASPQQNQSAYKKILRKHVYRLDMMYYLHKKKKINTIDKHGMCNVVL